MHANRLLINISILSCLEDTLIVSILCLSLFGCNMPKTKGKRNLKISEMINLSSCSEPVEYPIIGSNPFFVRSDKSLDIIDDKSHRIIRFNKSGKIVGSIGGIGRKENDLYYPIGIWEERDYIFVLNDEGRELKIFKESGEFVISFKLVEKAYGATSLIVVGDRIIIPLRKKYGSLDSVNNEPLLSIYDRSGKMVGTIGKTIPCRTAYGHYIFNSVFLCKDKDIIYGAFCYLPIIFSYDPQGNELLVKDLSHSGIPAIEKRLRMVTEMGMDTPQKISADNGVMSVIFNRGLAFHDKRLYYLIPEEGMLIFDKNGGYLAKLDILLDGEKPFVSDYFQLGPKGKVYGLGIRRDNKSLVYFGEK